MNVLVVNCGSSSLKYQLINSDSEEVLAKGICERIGLDGRLVYQKEGCEKEVTEAPMPTHKEAIQLVLDALVNPKTGAVAQLSEIDAVGHRVVHGGEKFSGSVVLTDEVLKQVEECNELAPLHNPANLIGIRACQEIMPGVPMVGYLTPRFTRPCQRKRFCMDFRMNTMKNIRSEDTGFMERATVLYQSIPQNILESIMAILRSSLHIWAAARLSALS